MTFYYLIMNIAYAINCNDILELIKSNVPAKNIIDVLQTTPLNESDIQC